MNFDKEEDDNDKVTIFVKKRNNRQSDTAISGLAKDLDLKKILSYNKIIVLISINFKNCIFLICHKTIL